MKAGPRTGRVVPGRIRRLFAAAIRDPLVHFVILGVLLFAVHEGVAPSAGADEGQRIVVDRNALLTFMQYRSNAFESEFFGTQLETLSEPALQRLTDDYVREEALYREALAMGLDRSDYIIRQRLVQKLEFLLEDMAGTLEEPSRAQLDAFYSEYRADYIEPSVYTFTHVYFDAEVRGDETAHVAAEAAIEMLIAEKAGFSDATRFGDRPLYFRNYVERTRDFVASHLGEGFIAALDALEPSDTVWRGPFASPFGWHVVLMTGRRVARLPHLDEIEPRVAEDFRRLRLERARSDAVTNLVAGYVIDEQLVVGE